MVALGQTAKREGGAAKGLIGTSLPRAEDGRLLTGRGRFIDDLSFPRMVHAVAVRSPAAHGLIRKIDLSEALALPGVLAAISFADVADYVKVIPIRIGGMPGFEHFLQFPLARDRVRFVGEPVAMVVAETRYIAEDAANLVTVDIEELPAIVTLAGAERGDPLIHPTAGTNLSRYSVSRGDADAAFARAPYRRKEFFSVQRHAASPMETRGLIAVWENSHMTVWGATKIPFFNRKILSSMLKLPESDIDLMTTDVGGGFGVRGEFYPEDFLVPFLAKKLGRPVKWIEDRREHLIATNHAREISCELEIACEKDGTILGLRGQLVVDIGAYARGTGGTAPSRAGQFLPGPYRIADYACEVVAHVSNKTPTGSYRGPGRFEANFFRERLMDMAAQDLGVSPVEMRRRNLVPASDMPYGIGKLVTYEEAGDYDSGDFHIPLELVLQKLDWAEKQKLQGIEINGWRQGFGLCCFVESGGGGGRENARIRVDPDGRIALSVGSTPMGQGHETVLAQICGEALDLPLDRIRVIHGSTNALSEGFGTWHGRTIIMGGSAILATAQAFLDRATSLAADYLGHPNVEIQWRGGRFVRSDEGAEVDLATLAAFAGGRGEIIDVEGTFVQSNKAFSYGTHGAHVAVNVRTGQVRLMDYVATEDIGRAINPAIVHGQVLGGVVQGLGGTFLEHLAYDETGQLLTGSLADYLLPGATDFANIRCFGLELALARDNPLGAKGAGEGGTVAVSAAIGNAVAAALRGIASEVRALPLTPPRVWALMNPKEKQQARG